MHLVLRRVGAVILLLIQCVISTPTALSVTPSVQWYGDDGTWSAVSIRVGTPPQWVDVMVSTVSSETWVVGPGGCVLPSSCSSARGGLFDLHNSSSWYSEGFYALGVDEKLGNTGYAEYGLDDLTFGTTGVVLPSAIIGSINTTGLINATQYLLGYFGLGIVPGSFNGSTPLSAISGLVEKEAVIPSHSYGYTAGAKYQQKGVPNSLTLGGYDANRFVPNDISFELSPSQVPQVYINSISVANTSFSSDLLYSTDRVFANIDSSTPYLWLPKPACDRFAESLGLTYDNSLNLYTFDANSSQHDVLQNAGLSFTFSLSDIESSPNLVNITLPYTAFDLQLTYPAIPDTDYADTNSTMYYFPLRQAMDETQYTIGRVFLQEAYLITDYERNNFSIHQAVHTADPIQNISIVSITRPSDSVLSGPPQHSNGMKLSTGGIIGIVIAAVVITVLLTFAVFFWYRVRHKKTVDDEKPVHKPTFLDRLRRRRQPLAHTPEASGDTNYPTEVGADASHERFELPAPLGPVELDSESGTWDGTTEHGSSTGDSPNISAYERARRKLERQRSAAQMQKTENYPVEKNETDISTVPHYRPLQTPDTDSPLISPMGPESGGSLTISGQTSPVSPGFVSAPISPTAPPTYTRINPANVVYAGRLPDNVQLPQIVPRMIGPDGRTIRSEETFSEPSTLGSQYTENGSDDLYRSGDTQDVNAPSLPSAPSEQSEPRVRKDHSLGRETSIQELLDPWGSRRRLEGEDLVHVPQPAENRFSWEEERTDGTD